MYLQQAEKITDTSGATGTVESLSTQLVEAVGSISVANPKRSIFWFCHNLKEGQQIRFSSIRILLVVLQ